MKIVTPPNQITSKRNVAMTTISESEKRLHRCCFTGHRPQKMQISESKLKLLIEKAIVDAIQQGFVTFISGMAIGYDIIAAETVLMLRKQYPHIHLICALPHPEFEKRWHKEWQCRYRRILSQADLIKVVSPCYSLASYQRRNEWMVSKSSLVIAAYNGTPGGTRNTIEFAKMNHVPVHMLDIPLGGIDNARLHG